MQVKKRDGSLEGINKSKIRHSVERAAKDLKDVDIELITNEAHQQIFDGIETKDIDKATLMAARARIIQEPNYSYLSARLLLNSIYREVFGHRLDGRTFVKDYKKTFVKNLEELVSLNRINPELTSGKFDLEELAEKIVVDRDLLFKYLGIQTLYDRYFLHSEERRLETPQAFWMRVAMGLALNENKPTERAIEFYNVISCLDSCPATPTLFNSGTVHSQLSSCYLSTVHDSIDGIYGSLHEQAKLSKYAGGLGIDLTGLRGTNSYIKGTNGKSQGLIPWAKQYNDMALAVNQGGKRKGAACLYLENWHIDYPEFLDLKKNTGDDRRRCHDINTASWISDTFMKSVENDDDWYLFSPDECKNLHDNFGIVFDCMYKDYVEKAKAGEIKNFQIVKAKDLWKQTLKAIKETGHPWVTFKDPSNIRYSNIHQGTVHNSNLCCVSGDDRIVTDRGILKVSELEKEGGENIVVGRDGLKNASEMQLTIKNSEMMLVETKEGYSHKVTPDHPLWVLKNGWVEAKDLKIGDKIEIQQVPGIWGAIDEPEIALICGYIAGDGTFGGESAMIDLWEKNIHLYKDIEETVENILKEHSDKYNIKYFSDICPKFNTNQYDEHKKYRLTSKPLANILSYYKFNKETKVKVPEFVWRGNKETVSNYLEGLFCCDGTIQVSGEITTVSLSSISKQLLKDVQILLANFGIKSTLTNLNKEGFRKLPNGKGDSSYYFCQDSYRLLITSIRACKKLEEVINIGKNRKNEKFLENIQKEGYKEKQFATVKSVQKIQNEDAYCLMVDSEDRAWTCNGLITKNTEILQHNKATTYNKDGDVEEIGETAVCNLHSLNLSNHCDDEGNIDYDKLAKTIYTVARMLDNVIDLNFYPSKEAKKSNLKHRFVGMGLMGWQDLLHKKKLAFDSDEAIQLAGNLQEFICYHVITKNVELAKQRGKYPSFEGSLWSNGELPQQTFEKMMVLREKDFPVKNNISWESLRQNVMKFGMRNALTFAIAPTVTISSICGCSPSIEPSYSVMYVNSTLSGEFTMINEFFVNEMKKLNAWNEETIKNIQYLDGDISEMLLPEPLKNRFKTAFDVDQKKLIDAAALRQIWIDQAQSLNLYFKDNSMKKLSELYFHAWEQGLKTTYYLHTKAASKIEKSTVKLNKNNNSCKIGGLKESCESCQ